MDDSQIDDTELKGFPLSLSPIPLFLHEGTLIMNLELFLEVVSYPVFDEWL